MWEQNALYIIATDTIYALARYTGINDLAKPMLSFNSVVTLTRGNFMDILKTNNIDAKVVNKRVVFPGPLWVHQDSIRCALSVKMVDPAKKVPPPAEQQAKPEVTYDTSVA